jgi:hypothetical protein
MGSLVHSGATAPGREHSSRQREVYPAHPLRRWVFGDLIWTEHQEHTRLPKLLAFPVISSDAIFSEAGAARWLLPVVSVFIRDVEDSLPSVAGG